MSWATATAVESKFRPTLVARARKRTVQGPLAGGCWIVKGDPKLGDSYDSYLVQINGSDPKCSCQSHEYGEHRRTCSHGVAALLALEEMGDLGLSVTVEPREEAGDQPAVKRASDVDIDATRLPTSPSGLLPPLDDRDAWGRLSFPDWLTDIRPHQEKAVLDVEREFESGSKVVIVSAPTGTGKTLIAELARRRLGRGAIYSCTTKTLQEQMAGDYPYAKVLKGRANYPTQLHPDRFDLSPALKLSCEDCTWTKSKPDCRWCEEKSLCPYEGAKKAALEAGLAVLNTAYLLTECNGPRKFSGRGLVILDEADLLESALMSWAEVRVSKKWQAELGIGAPEIVTHSAKAAPETWRAWAEDAYAKVSARRSSIPDADEEIKSVRARKHLDGLKRSLKLLVEGLGDLESPEWVYTEDGTGAVVFRPVKVSQLGQEVLWQHGERFLLMSASVISPDEMMESLGFHGQWGVVEVDSTFDPERRPVYASPVANVVSKEYEESVPKLARAVEKIAERHPHDNILVHTVSYRLAKDLSREVRVGHAKFGYASAAGREASLQRFKASSKPSIMIAPSLDRGVDLPDDLCRVTVVCKVPYPYLGDRQVSARLYSPGGQTWYRVQTLRSIIQMTGRGMRHKEDSCTSYILDRQFSELWKKAGHLLPGWWKEAVRWELPPWMGGGG